MTATERVLLSETVENSTAAFQSFNPSRKQKIHEFYMQWNEVFLMINFNISYNTHTHTHTHTYIYIYIYIERERERVMGIVSFSPGGQDART